MGEGLKLPPQALEAEQSVLGGLLINNLPWEEVAETITADDFYSQNHRQIFTALQSLCGSGQPADVVTVSERLGQTGEIEDVGGLAYLGSLAHNTPSTANLIAYAKIVHERAVLRKLINAANEIINTAFHPEGRTSDEVLDHAEKVVFDIAQHSIRRGTGFRDIAGLLTEAVDRIEELYGSDQTVTGLATGFSDLDELTSGLQPSDLIIVAGRPSMGKTSLSMNIVENVAVGLKKPVAVFSMEMPGQQLAMRMMSSLGRINAQKIRTGRLADEDWPRLTSAVELLNQAPIFIDDTPGLTPLELRSRARRLQRQHGELGLLVVDYLQLMQSIDSSENRATEVSAMTRALKMLAKELNIPVIVMSQLNRSLEQRPNKRPVMSDLRESGAIEQDADVIFFIYRDEIYNEESEDKGIAEVIIGKQRNGPTGTVRMTFLGEYTRFENYASPAYDSNFG